MFRYSWVKKQQTSKGPFRVTIDQHAGHTHATAGAIGSNARPHICNRRARYGAKASPRDVLQTIETLLPKARKFACMRVSKDVHACCIGLDSSRCASRVGSNCLRHVLHGPECCFTTYTSTLDSHQFFSSPICLCCQRSLATNYIRSF